MPQLISGPVRLVLSRGGHIAGIISPPGKKRASYWTNEQAVADPDAWLASATAYEGGWWLDWRSWLAERSGGSQEPPSTGSEAFPSLIDAPGSYVLET